jgi:hypothetical protein
LRRANLARFELNAAASGNEDVPQGEDRLFNGDALVALGEALRLARMRWRK